MARARYLRDHCRPLSVIWIAVVFLFFLGFRMALENSRSNHLLTSGGSFVSSYDMRAALYDRMERDLDEKGAAFLQGRTSQPLLMSDMFELKDGAVRPVLKAINPPVRANVLYISPEYSVPISQVVKDTFLPYLDKVIWFQNASLYHSSMFHASHHVTSIFATDSEIEAEADAVKSIADNLCPLEIVLDRVVLTSTGVLLGCWQVASGTDPVEIRAKLRDALPRAPEKQLYDPVIFHTSFARILGHPKIPWEEASEPNDRPVGNPVAIFETMTTFLSLPKKTSKAAISELWFVEEFDVLALALDGKMTIRKFHLGCCEGLKHRTVSHTV